MFSKAQKPLPPARISANPNQNLSLVDRAGILLGDNCYWNPEKLANPHGAIIGSSGSGKTQTLKAIAWSILKQYSTKLIIIDFHGDQEIPGEVCYRINMESSHGINPLVIEGQ
jgi:type IV secretory pathway VirB4 component